MKIDPGTKVFVDTNVLLEATDEGRAMHGRAMTVFARWPGDGVELHIGTQVIREYLVVATRPTANNGLGMAVDDALENIRRFRQTAAVVGETTQAGETFLKWARQFQTRGKKLHDLQILATATAAGMTALLTANPADFPAPCPPRIVGLVEVEPMDEGAANRQGA